MSVYPDGVEVLRSAHVSECGLYRYSLMRSWSEWDEEGRALPFIMLNPSTADAKDDDPTIRRCVGLARALGYNGIFVCNLYAYRATKPVALWRAREKGVDIVGDHRNDQTLRTTMEFCVELDRPVVAAWGVGGDGDRVREIVAMDGSKALHAFAVTNSGAPRHPLYLPADSQLTPWPTKETR